MRHVFGPESGAALPLSKVKPPTPVPAMRVKTPLVSSLKTEYCPLLPMYTLPAESTATLGGATMVTELPGAAVGGAGTPASVLIRYSGAVCAGALRGNPTTTARLHATRPAK